MDNATLKSIISSIVADEYELNKVIVLEGDEFADGAVGLTVDNHVVYDAVKTRDSLMKHNNWTEEEAEEWLDYNTFRSLPYMASSGNEPIFLRCSFT